MNEAAPSIQLLRRVNAGVILGILRDSGVMMGTELMAATGLTRATVIAICDELISAGWVKELENQRAGGDYVKGRPARRFAFDADAAYVVGVDIGGNKVTAVVADLLGALRAKVVVHTPEVPLDGHSDSRSSALLEAVEAVLSEGGVPPSAVLAASVGVAAPVDREGVVLTAQDFWKSYDIHGVLGGKYGWHTRIENDANLAALAERWQGTGRGIDDLAVLLAGERLGSGIIESGRLLHGFKGAFGELGFLAHVEGVGDSLGITFLARTWGREALALRPALMNRLCGGNPELLASEMVFAAAAEGDPAAKEILDRVAARMARVIAAVSTLVNPELVVIGGAVAESAEVLLPGIREQLPQFTATPPRVVASNLGDTIVSLGAVRHALDYVESRFLELKPGGATAGT